MRLTTTTRQADSVTIVDVSGRIVLGQETASLRSLLSDLLSKGHNKILLNLAHVDYIDSSGIGYLVRALSNVRSHNGELKVLSPSKNVQDVLQKTNLCSILDVKDDEGVAIRSFRGASSV